MRGHRKHSKLTVRGAFLCPPSGKIAFRNPQSLHVFKTGNNSLSKVCNIPKPSDQILITPDGHRSRPI